MPRKPELFAVLVTFGNMPYQLPYAKNIEGWETAEKLQEAAKRSRYLDARIVTKKQFEREVAERLERIAPHFEQTEPQERGGEEPQRKPDPQAQEVHDLRTLPGESGLVQADRLLATLLS